MSSKRAFYDRLEKRIEVGDIVIVGSANRVRIAKVYGIGNFGQPLCDTLVGLPGKGFLGYDYIVLSRDGIIEAEVENAIHDNS